MTSELRLLGPDEGDSVEDRERAGLVRMLAGVTEGLRLLPAWSNVWPTAERFRQFLRRALKRR